MLLFLALNAVSFACFGNSGAQTVSLNGYEVEFISGGMVVGSGEEGSYRGSYVSMFPLEGAVFLNGVKLLMEKDGVSDEFVMFVFEGIVDNSALEDESFKLEFFDAEGVTHIFSGSFDHENQIYILNYFLNDHQG